MTEYTMRVNNSLEARLAALFVQTASKFDASIHVRIDTKTVNAKSIMGIISLGILDGQDITLIAEGEDEKEAVLELERFLNSMN